MGTYEMPETHEAPVAAVKGGGASIISPCPVPQGCKLSRRKCTGDLPCAYCVKRGSTCTYDDAPPGKRGPKGRHAVLEAENASLRAELDRLREQAASQVQRQRGSTGAGLADELHPRSVWTITGPIVPTAQEEALLEGYFKVTNKIIPGKLHRSATASARCRPRWHATHFHDSPLYVPHAQITTAAVDEEYFRAALETARYLDEPTAPSPAEGGGASGQVVESPFTDVQRHSELFGFRVAFYTLLCIGARVAGDSKAARRYYELARAYIGPCYSQPSQHLVSALLLMVMISRSLNSPGQAAIHAALALRMSELVDVSARRRVCPAMLSTALLLLRLSSRCPLSDARR